MMFMKIKAKIYLLCLLSLFTGCAQWQTVGSVKGENKVAYSVEKSSIVRNGNFAIFTSKAIYPSSRNVSYFPPHTAVLSTWEVNCKTKKYRLLKTQLLDKNERVVMEERNNIEQHNQQKDFLDPPAPSSAMYLQQRYVCR